jgi:glycerophosphoryl diester phosphodiesterase
MKKHFLPLIAVISLFTVFLNSCSGGSDKEVSPEFNLYDQSGETLKSLSVSKDASETVIRAYSNVVWTLASNVSWINVTPASGKPGAAQLKVAVSANAEKSVRTGAVSFTAGSLRYELSIFQAASDGSSEPEDVPKADLLNVKFFNDGSAYDISGNDISVTEVSGSSMVNYYSDLYSRYISHFNHTPGDEISEGYYKADYSSCPKFINGLSDGHSLEILFRPDQKSSGSSEIKMFSSMQSGGTGFLISKASKGTQLTFLPNVSTSGSSNWIWTGSGINPEAGRYYHAVGVWNKDAGKSYIYVDGELKGTQTASGSFVPPSSKDCYWFGIGADAGKSGGEAAWKGDIVLARVYDDPLTADQVKALYDAVKIDQPSESINISDISFLTPCQIAESYKYYIYGSGFKSGDSIELESLANENSKFECTAVTGSGFIKAAIPIGFVSGNYRIMLKRAGLQYPLGSVSMTVTDNPVNIGNTKVIAHRGYHTTGAAENSVEALRKAQELGVYGSEFDVWITTDGVVVVNHNATVGTNAKRIENSTYDDIKDITLSNGEKLPTLADFLEQGKKSTTTKLILEVKTHTQRADNNRVVDSVMTAVTAAGMDERMVYIAFDYDNCKRILAAKPDAIVMYLNGDKSPSTVLADGIKGIDYSSSVLTNHPEWLTEASRKGVLVNVWTVDDSQGMLKYISAGVDFITTNNPDVLKSLIGKTYISKD